MLKQGKDEQASPAPASGNEDLPVREIITALENSDHELLQNIFNICDGSDKYRAAIAYITTQPQHYHRLISYIVSYPRNRGTEKVKNLLMKLIDSTIKGDHFLIDASSDLKHVCDLFLRTKEPSESINIFKRCYMYVPKALAGNSEANTTYARQIANHLSEQKLYDHAFYFGYLSNHHLPLNKERYRYLFQLLAMTLMSPALKSYQAHILQILKENAKYCDYGVAKIAAATLAVNYNNFSVHQRKILLEIILKMQIEGHEKLEFVFESLDLDMAIDPANFEIGKLIELELLADSSKNHIADLVKLQSYINRLSKFNPAKYLLIRAHDRIARMTQQPEICKQHIGKTLDEFERTSEGDPNFCSLLDEISPLLGLAHRNRINSESAPTDNFFNTNIPISIYYSEAMDKIPDQVWRDLFKNSPNIVADGITIAIHQRDPYIIDRLLTILERLLPTLSPNEITTRAKVLNVPSDAVHKKMGTPLACAIRYQDDNHAVRLYKLQARKIENTVDPDQVVRFAIEHGCFDLVIAATTKTISSPMVQALVQAGTPDINRVPLSEHTASFGLMAMNHAAKTGSPPVLLLMKLTVAHFLRVMPGTSAHINTLYKECTKDNNYIMLQALLEKINNAQQCLVDNLRDNNINIDCMMLFFPRTPAAIILRQYVMGLSGGHFDRILKKKLLMPYPTVATTVIDYLARAHDHVTNYHPPFMTENIFLLFNSLILNGDFNAPVLIYLYLSLPTVFATTQQLDRKNYTAKEKLSWLIIKIIAAAYTSDSKTFLGIFRQYFHSKSALMTLANELQLQTLVFKTLPEHLLVLRKQDRELMAPTIAWLKAMLDELQKPVVIPTSEQALLDDSLEDYKKQVHTYSLADKLAHIAKLAAKEDSQILAYLFRHFKPSKITLSNEAKIQILTDLVEHNNHLSLSTAVSNDITDPNCSATATPRDCLFMDALNKRLFDCADALLPTYVPSELLVAVATVGPARLFQRAFDHHCLHNGDDQNVSYETLQKICIDDKDKLTVITLTRIREKKRYEAEHGKANKKPRYNKPKSRNPGGKELFDRFNHQLNIVKIYAKTHAENPQEYPKISILSEDDTRACAVVLQVLNKEYTACGYDNLLANTTKDEAGQLKSFIESIEVISEDLHLAVISRLDHLASITKKQTSPPPAAAVAAKPAAATIGGSSGKKEKKFYRKPAPPMSKPTAALSLQGEPSAIYRKTSLPEITLLKNPVADAAPVATPASTPEPEPHHSETQLNCVTQEILADVRQTIDKIKLLLATIPDALEKEIFSDEIYQELIKHYTELNTLFHELDDDLSDVYKAQLKLIDINQPMDDEHKKEMAAFAKQFLVGPAQLQQDDPVNKIICVERASQHRFFQLATIHDSINTFCRMRFAELRTARERPNNLDEIHFIVFRIANALGKEYRQPNRIRHYLIHRFYLIELADLLAFADAISPIDNFTNKKYVLNVIEKTALYNQAQDFIRQLVQPSKMVSNIKKNNVDLNSETILIQQKLQQAQIDNNATKVLWFTVLIGELSKQINIIPLLMITAVTLNQCRNIRNVITHEKYEETINNAPSVLIGKLDNAVLLNVVIELLQHQPTKATTLSCGKT